MLFLEQFPESPNWAVKFRGFIEILLGCHVKVMGSVHLLESKGVKGKNRQAILLAEPVLQYLRPLTLC